MKICIISTMDGGPWGGSEELWAATAHAALDDGHELGIVVHRWPEKPRPILDLESRGACFFFRDVDLSRRSSRVYERLVGPLRSLALWRPEVVLISQGTALQLMWRGDIDRLLRTLDVPYALVLQYNSDLHATDDFGRRKTIAYFEKATWVGFVAERNLQTARRQLADPIANGIVVRNPVNLKRLEIVPRPRPAGPWRMASVGRLQVSDKGQDILLEALAGPIWGDRDWRLRLYGQGPDRGYLEDLARFYGIGDRVEFPGHVSDIGTLWADNHILALPSRAEGTPLAMVEAMICGRPIVATDVGGNAEWVDEPSTGFIAEAPTARSFGAALDRAWSMREDWEVMGAAAHRSAVARLESDPGRALLTLLLDATRPASLAAGSPVEAERAGAPRAGR